MNCIDCNKQLSKIKYKRCLTCRGKNDILTMKISRICKNCEIKFKIIPYYVKIGKGIFCSQRCSAQYRYPTSKNFIQASIKLTSNQRGAKNKMWRGGITPLIQQIRGSLKYKQWRQAIFKRDNYQCVFGGKEHGPDVQADHIKPFSLYPDLRFTLSNGRTLCVKCHRKTETYGYNSRYLPGGEARIL